MIVVASKAQPFAKAIAQQLVHELATACDCTRSCEEALALQPSLIITDEAISDHGAIPIITITPPVRLAELIHNIRSHQALGGELYPLMGGVVFDVRMKQLSKPASHASMDLTDKEAKLLEALLKEKQQAVSREKLLQQVWGIDAQLNTHTLETHIYRLRGKLNEFCGKEFIAATDGGYRLSL